MNEEGKTSRGRLQLLYFIELLPMGLALIFLSDGALELKFLYSAGLYALCFSLWTPEGAEAFLFPTCILLLIVMPLFFTKIVKRTNSSSVVALGFFTLLTFFNALIAHTVWLPGIYG